MEAVVEPGALEVVGTLSVPEVLGVVTSIVDPVE